ncbi:DUF5366 family protein [Desertibacillus haloalkaliphilus]|uniref:DUF5366 family protein n=1 Tax=Desertibacillus haloalkaliphilus TaxID=1328930 RepID=UPI001C267808|nr:DUF5366 family protein [Desertibacillus haloalkaliphilus]MBU8908932.1 YufK family protein [Desertibacillus haloalkaliphilus]
MKNTYLTSHFPLFSILLFSTALAMYSQSVIITKLDDLGLYQGMMEFFSESGIKGTLLFLLLLFFFMVFSALKLISDTMVQLSLLFFSKDEEGVSLTTIRSGSWIYLIASVAALLGSTFIEVIVGVFLVATLIYFVFFVYKISDSLSALGLFGVVFFHTFFWFSFVLAISFAVLRLYNSFMASLPL